MIIKIGSRFVTSKVIYKIVYSTVSLSAASVGIRRDINSIIYNILINNDKLLDKY